jgi:hypothetical protein
MVFGIGQKGYKNMTDFNLDDIIVKEVADVTPEEKTFLETNKADLDDEIAAKFGIDTTPTVPDPVVRGAKVDEGGDDKNKGKAILEPTDDEDDDLLEPEAKKKIASEVQKATEPIRQQFEQQSKQLQEQRDIAEVDNYIRNDKTGVAIKYRDAMLKYMKVYTQVPADGVFRIVAGDELMRIGAKKEREASEKARGTRVQTNSARPSGSAKKDWGTASKEDYMAKRAEVLGRPS